MVRPVKRKQIPNLREQIKATAWRQIAEFGAPALSLRAIARELTISAPAIYNYFPDPRCACHSTHHRRLHILW